MNDVKALILAMRAPEWTPEFQALHEEMLAPARDKNVEVLTKLMALCTDPECIVCGALACPYSEPLHFHHDGCPACWNEEEREEGRV